MELDDGVPEGGDDPQGVAEYVSDIFTTLSRDEAKFMPRPSYMDSQSDVNPKMRAILVDWLIEVHVKYKLKCETLFLAVNIIDRFLDQQPVLRKKLQLVGVTAMLIASKFEEIFPPEIHKFIFITANAYSMEEILQMEVAMLVKLSFTVCCPTMAHFMERFVRANDCTDQHRHLVQYLLELTLSDIKMLQYPPSHAAAAAVLLSNKLLKVQPAWPPAVAQQTNLAEATVKDCARDICLLLEAAEKNPDLAVRRKFSCAKFGFVALQTY